ncbi:MAG TPA: M20/M25/M40 family metallo-hydrolase [Gemmatimonadaceae bacterium]|nr:M20/M25/M40 family metallo-hydrolase [Gemmatimonadaceae bacterium]
MPAARVRIATLAVALATSVFGACAPHTAHAVAAPVAVQPPIAVPTNDSIVARLVNEGLRHSHVAADIEYLLDVIGPRLTGSAGMDSASAWAQRKFLEYHLDRAELEPWKFGVGWTRGPITVRMLEPQGREMIGASWGWSPGTRGAVAGKVVLMDARTSDEFEHRFAGKLRGAWVLVGAASAVLNPADSSPAAIAARDSVARANAPTTQDEREFALYRYGYVAAEHIAGILHDGGKPYNLLSMSGSPGFVSPVPQIVIGHDDYAQLERLARRGTPARIEADISNSFTRDTLVAHNTVAELRGSEKPGELVILGAHLDSWDLATGGTDNGAGAIAVLEAARILAASGARPKRTIRFVLFSGEEEGLYGSQAYAAAHAKELDSVQALLVLDNGTGRITALPLQGRDELRGMWESMMQPLDAVPEIGAIAVRSGIKTGTDHLSFTPFGVPAFNYDQLSRGYDFTHHSQIDDEDHVIPADIAQAATVMAVNAWQLANMDALLPRGRKQ